MSPDKRTHRGAHPEDRRLFGADTLPLLRRAVADLSLLLTWDYPLEASLKLVGDRYRLDQRQRMAVRRASCSDQARQGRETRRRPLEAVSRRPLMIDGFNLLITLETAIGGGVIFRCRDGGLRDLAGIHGSYRAVAETDAAIVHAGRLLAAFAPSHCLWLLDRPVSNSGRLRRRLEEVAQLNAWPWSVELEFNPDGVMIARNELAATSDTNILDAGAAWINLAAAVTDERLRNVWIVDLTDQTPNAPAP